MTSLQGLSKRYLFISGRGSLINRRVTQNIINKHCNFAKLCVKLSLFFC
jgi:hypothetical protein